MILLKIYLDSLSGDKKLDFLIAKVDTLGHSLENTNNALRQLLGVLTRQFVTQEEGSSHFCL